MRWIHETQHERALRYLAKKLGCSTILADLLMRRGVRTEQEARSFLTPPLAEVGDPFHLVNLEAAVQRLLRAIAERHTITVFGDYDVDGVTSTAILVSILRHFDCQPNFVVPLRLEEGYGLSQQAVERMLEERKPDLLVALDCGTNSVQEVDFLKKKGVDVIIVDHHRCKDRMPEGAILVNPHVHEDPTEWTNNLCTAGLVFKLVHGLLKRLRSANDPRALNIRLRDYLDLVAMGTVADLVPLVGENRILARHGLKVLQKTKRPGLLSLMQVSGIKKNTRINPLDISFRIGPRINASGRLADASISVELLLNEDEDYCNETALKLDGYNRDRQEIERQITEEAIRMVEGRLAESAGLVLFNPGWHPGVVGIVASRVSRQFHRPCIVLGQENEYAKGSGRGVEGINLVEVLSQCSGLLQSWGGHPMAVGVSLFSDKVREFQELFSQVVESRRGLDTQESALQISRWIQLEEINPDLLDEIELLHPFGQGNPEPVFAARNVRIAQPVELIREQHYRFLLMDRFRRRLSGIAWNQAGRPLPFDQSVDIAFRLAWNEFGRKRYPQLELADWKAPVSS